MAVRERGKSFEAPTWWLDTARKQVATHGQLEKLGAELAKLVSRKKAWNHGTLSKFANGDPSMKPTQELAHAISLKFNIPAPVYIPNSLVEAEAMQAAQKLAISSSKNTEKTSGVRINRETHLDSQIGQLEGEADRHTVTLGSADESAGSKGRRGRGRVG